MIVGPDSLFIPRDSIFWDFDGVIKDSNDVKAEAFASLFESESPEFVERVKTFHYNNPHLTREQKVQRFLDWSPGNLGGLCLDDLVCLFSERVRGGVVASNWVEGVIEFQARLKSDLPDTNHYLVTATPGREIIWILREIGLFDFFADIEAGSGEKTKAVRYLIQKHKINRDATILVGDGANDYEAARDNGLLFFLRRTPHNEDLCRVLPREHIFDNYLQLMEDDKQFGRFMYTKNQA